MSIPKNIRKAAHLAMCLLDNQLRFRKSGLRPNQTFTIAPSDITHRHSPRKNNGFVISPRYSGLVLGGEWDQNRTRYDTTRKYKACAARFRDGQSWEDSGVIDYMLKRIEKEGPVDSCASRPDVLARYARLDDLWEKTITTRNLPPVSQIARKGILVHIDRDGKPLFGNQGFHRLAIAQLAKLDTLDVSLGVVHEHALKQGRFQP